LLGRLGATFNHNHSFSDSKSKNKLLGGFKITPKENCVNFVESLIASHSTHGRATTVDIVPGNVPWLPIVLQTVSVRQLEKEK